jgi:hypothetical protein
MNPDPHDRSSTVSALMPLKRASISSNSFSIPSNTIHIYMSARSLLSYTYISIHTWETIRYKILAVPSLIYSIHTYT